MKQDINLYQSVFHPRRDFFQSKNILLYLLVLLLVLAMIWGMKAAQLSNLKNQVQEVAKEKQRLQNRIQRLENKYPKPKVNKDLKKRVSKLRQEKKKRLNLLDNLDKEMPRSEQGFSDYLQGLARQKVDGLWIGNFKIVLDEEAYFHLEGWTYKAQLIPKYLRNLSREDSFSRIAFDKIKVNRVEDKSDVLGFSLSTRDRAAP